MMKKTILILAANPTDTSRLRLDQEIREIEQGLRLAANRDNFELKQKLAIRPEDFRRALLELKPNYVHFSGHGEGEKGIILENSVEKKHLVSAEALAGLFELFQDSIDCVVLNACYSEVQAKAIAQHIPYVIGMNSEIGDRAAITFAVAFYDALGAGQAIDFAYKLACNAIAFEGIKGHLTPILIQGQAQRKISQIPENKSKTTQPPSSFSARKKAMLEKRLEHLNQRYEAAFEQRESTLNESDKFALDNQLAHLEKEIQKTAQEINELP